MSICFHACVCVQTCMLACICACMIGLMPKGMWTVAPGQRSMQSTDCLHLCQFHLGNWLATIHSVPVTTTFLFTGRWCSTTGESISANFYCSQNEDMPGLNYAFSDQNRQRKCSVFVSFHISLCHSTLCIPMLRLTHVHSRRVVPAFGTVFIGTVSVAWIEPAGPLAADDNASVWT